MDQLDFKILEVLDWHGREQVIDIAEKVKSNKDVVAYRIKKMEEEGIIRRYYPVIDLYRLGYNLSRFYFDLEEMTPEEEKDFVSFLDLSMDSSLIFRMDYPYRYGNFLWTKSMFEVQNAITRIKKKLGKRLIKYNYTLIHTYRQYPKDYLFGKEKHREFISLEPRKEAKYDKNDYRILRKLAQDARFSTVQIAKRLKIPQTTVFSKIKNLEKKRIILGYRADIDYIKLGYMNFFLEIYLDESRNLRDIEKWADKNKNVVWLQKIIGTCDMEIEVEVKNRIELEKLLNELREKFPNIRKIVFWSQEYRKLTFLP